MAMDADARPYPVYVHDDDDDDDDDAVEATERLPHDSDGWPTLSRRNAAGTLSRRDPAATTMQQSTNPVLGGWPTLAHHEDASTPPRSLAAEHQRTQGNRPTHEQMHADGFEWVRADVSERMSSTGLDLSSFDLRSLRDSITGDLRPSIHTRLFPTTR